jgi:hypothetical protein
LQTHSKAYRRGTQRFFSTECSRLFYAREIACWFAKFRKQMESVFSSVCFSLQFTIFFFMQRKAKFPRHKVCSPHQGCLRSRNWQALDSGALLLEQRFERTKPESVTERPRIHARRRATTLMSRVQTRRDETKRKPVQKFRTAVAIQRQRHKSRDQKKWTDAQDTSERYRKEQGNTGK